MSNTGYAGGQPERERRYVWVVSLTSPEGQVTPLEVRWDDGRRFVVDEVLERRRARSLRTGLPGVRYTVRIGRATTHLFFEDETRAWFVRAKRG